MLCRHLDVDHVVDGFLLQLHPQKTLPAVRDVEETERQQGEVREEA